MKKNLTELVFILDKSGSMAGLEADTIGGFNSMIEKQKKEDGEALVSAVLFSNESKVIYDRVHIRKVEPLTDEQYSVGGCTALIRDQRAVCSLESVLYSLPGSCTQRGCRLRIEHLFRTGNGEDNQECQVKIRLVRCYPVKVIAGKETFAAL